MTDSKTHIPVLLNEVMGFLSPLDNKIYVDATFGAGGYSKAILKTPEARVIAIDQDESVISYANQINKDFGNRLQLVQSNFQNIKQILLSKNILSCAGIVFDIGVSSMQIDNGERGFSFMHDGPLDMRMNQNSDITAYDIVNGYSCDALASIIFKYGDEKKSYRIAKNICYEREKSPINSTKQLSTIIANAAQPYRDTINPATRTFQALRIVVNDELKALSMALEGLEEYLEINGIIAIVTFHSLEDSIVKNAFNKISEPKVHKNKYVTSKLICDPNKKMYNNLTRRVIAPSEAEVRSNIRARSAKLRVIRRVQ